MKEKFTGKALAFCFAGYILFLCWILFVNVGSTNRITSHREKQPHFIPFENTYTTLSNLIMDRIGTDDTSHYWYLAIRNILGNILLFIPFGFLGFMLFRMFNTLKNVLAGTAIFCVCAETIQYALDVGVFDVDDIIYNCLGAAIGFLLANSNKFFAVKS